MKQILVVIIAICYAFGSAEVSLHFHYCGEVFQYVSLFSDEEKDSCCGETGGMRDCCSSDVVKGDVDDHKQAPKFFSLYNKAVGDIVSLITDDILNDIRYVNTPLPYSTLHPPPIISSKVYLDHCLFLI